MALVTAKAGNHTENGVVSAFKKSDLENIRAAAKMRELSVNKPSLFPPLNILRDFTKILIEKENKKVITLKDVLER